MRKRLISIITVFAMVATIIPASFVVASAETKVTLNSDVVAVINEYAEYYASTKEDKEAAKEEFRNAATAGMEAWLADSKYDDKGKAYTDDFAIYKEYLDKKGTEEEIVDPGLPNCYPMLIWIDFVTDTGKLATLASGDELNKTLDVEVEKCICNSDVIFKGRAKIIEAVQTENDMMIMYNVMSLYPKVTDEIKKCLGAESADDKLPFYTEFRKFCQSKSTVEETICGLLSNDKLNPTAVKTASGVSLKWNAVEGIDGYEIYVQEADGTFKLLDKTASNSYTANKIAASYNIVEYVVLDNVTYRGKAYNAVPTLNNTKIKKLYKGRKKFTVKWTAVSGANAYEISYYRVRSKKKLQKVSSVYVAGNTKATVKKLKAHRTYKVKIRPVYSADGVTLVGSWTKNKKVRTR